jgi:hypothetical protein
MKAIFLYRPDSEQARRVEEYVRDFELSQKHKLELLNIDTREGSSTASLYDLVENPSLIVIRDDGQLLKHWQGVSQLPLMNELSGYLSS